MSVGFSKSLCYPLESNQFEGLSVPNSSGSYICISSQRYFQDGQVSKIRSECSYQALVDLNLNSVDKRKERTNNLELKNGRIIISQVALVIVQIDASKNGWQPFRWGNVSRVSVDKRGMSHAHNHIRVQSSSL